MHASPTWLRWLALILVLLTGVMGSFAASTCHCGHEDAAQHNPDACSDDCADACGGLCACHLTIVPWHPPAVLAAAARPLHALGMAPARPGDPQARLIYSLPRR